MGTWHQAHPPAHHHNNPGLHHRHHRTQKESSSRRRSWRVGRAPRPCRCPHRIWGGWPRTPLGPTRREQSSPRQGEGEVSQGTEISAHCSSYIDDRISDLASSIGVGESVVAQPHPATTHLHPPRIDLHASSSDLDPVVIPRCHEPEFEALLLRRPCSCAPPWSMPLDQHEFGQSPTHWPAPTRRRHCGGGKVWRRVLEQRADVLDGSSTIVGG